MTYDRAYFDKGIDRRNTECVKWDSRNVMGEGGIPLWVADMDFPCPEPITQAILKRAQHPCFGYYAGSDEDAGALISFWQRRHGLAILPEQTRMLPCVITGLKACVQAFTAPGDTVALFSPVYGPFFEAVRLNGRQVAAVPLLRDEETGRYGMNISGMEEALQNGARLIMLCSPHNPVSRLWTARELTALCALAGAYDVPIVCDEIHADFVYAPGAFTPILSLEEGKKRAVMLCSASKTFNVAGLQQATAVCFSPALLERMNRALDAAGAACGNLFALCATRAAYTRCDDWLDGLMAYLDENRQALAQWTAQYVPKARLTPIEATYLAWLDLRAYGMTCEEMTEKCRRRGVAFTPGTFFGPEGEGFLRVNFACPRDQLKEGVKRLALALEEE